MDSIELHFIEENFLKNYSDFLVYNIIHLVIIKSAKCLSSFFLWEVKEVFTVVQWKMHKIYSLFLWPTQNPIGCLFRYHVRTILFFGQHKRKQSHLLHFLQLLHFF